MGKAENIKRAKKLREAKRIREQIALVEQGLGPAAKALQEKSAKEGVETQLNLSGVKYSELLKYYIEPLMSKTDNISDVKLNLSFGVLVWNAAIMGEKDEKHIQSAKDEIFEVMPDNLKILHLFDDMIKRKQEKFKEFKNIIVNFELRKINKVDYDLTVATTPVLD